MNVEIKKTVKAGNSSAVILPRAWLNKEVSIELIERTPESILLDVLNIVKNHISLSEIIGVYLSGSYARGEETKESDIDILIITKNIDKKAIDEGIYSILIVSEELMKQKLENNLFPVGQMIKEAKALINSDYIKKIEVRVTNKNVKWYLDTTEDKITLIESAIAKSLNKIDNQVTYTLILRLRTLYIIEQLLKNKVYSNKEFIKIIKDVSGSDNAFTSYLYEKNNQEKAELTSKKEAQNLLAYLKKQLKEIKNKV